MLSGRKGTRAHTDAHVDIRKQEMNLVFSVPAPPKTRGDAHLRVCVYQCFKAVVGKSTVLPLTALIAFSFQ